MYLDEIEVGMKIKLPAVVIGKAQMLDFAKLYDPLPLHLDEEYAKRSRFGGLIAPGVMSFMAVWGKLAEIDIFGDALVAGKSTKVEWCKPVYVEDTLTGTAVITGTSRRNAYNGIAEITLDAYNQHGELVFTSVTEAVVRYKPQPQQ